MITKNLIKKETDKVQLAAWLMAQFTVANKDNTRSERLLDEGSMDRLSEIQSEVARI